MKTLLVENISFIPDFLRQIAPPARKADNYFPNFRFTFRDFCNTRISMALTKGNSFRVSDASRTAKMLYRSGRGVKTWVRKNCGSRQDAEDILQDAVIATLNLLRKPEFVLMVPPKGLLMSVAKKMWLHELRKRKQNANISLEDEHAIPDHENDWLEEELRMQEAEKAISSLGERCRQLLEFFYLEKRSMDWISEKMEFRNRNVVKSMKVKCLDKARALVNTKEYERSGLD